ncbi:bifunctional heptose 7-phosphate kinase/heptose 1-phosphate adenyltransferase [Leucobacter muris]|uniref:Bifunctional heptose 7-phosphate kinase/heptose 1-phosphate adenyltransferase n=1 Tax=Leucobacter muris TaxID=1935379 RepID=A0ABX5QGM8_9MICO|nr:PfkB family carbohydrate kinase [Leucobacter muris]QAB18121.1 bifunctional heptose 7-phosphate kinase/heptose 1-phosphate adenyltransferase [Leucobacter muris]
MRITVVGDTLLDEDVEGTIERLCPDAPVPVVDVSAHRFRAGGAGLVAAMLHHDGHEVELVTALGDDEAARRIRERLPGVSIIACDSAAPTPVKRRVRTADQAVCRIDEGCGPPPVPRVDDLALAAVSRAEAIVVSDYGRRLTEHPELRAALQRRALRVPLVWDPHPRGTEPVSAARLVTPNIDEAAAAAGTGRGAAHASEAAERLRERYGCAAVLVTLGELGALLHEGERAPVEITTDPVEAADPCGAGDRLISAAAAALGRGAGLEEAAREAVASARAYLAAGGVASLPEPETIEAPAGAPTDDPIALARSVHERGGTVVAAGGCFDLLHAGHVRTLAAARDMGDCLVVCLNSDDSVRRLKGPERPIIREHDRVEMLLALNCVDAVLVFDEDGPERALERLRPHVWVKGGDYTVEALPETPLLRSWGGTTVTVPYHLGRSTTRLATALARVG